MRKYIVLAGILAGVLLFAPAVLKIMSAEQVTFTVNDKERIVESSGNVTTSKYLIYTDRGVYENTDALLFFKWNSSDVYAELERGQTYTATVAGWRVPFLSWYENIVKIE